MPPLLCYYLFCFLNPGNRMRRKQDAVRRVIFFGSEGLFVQPIRQRVIEILKENGSATVAQLADMLGMAQVSVRHHLDILMGEDLVELAGVQRHNGAGRPSQIYILTANAARLFPQRHEALANDLLAELKASLTGSELRQMLERVARRTALEAPLPAAQQSLEDRLDQVTDFLSDRGYDARWNAHDGQYELHVCNCPYSGVSNHHPELCTMDQAMVEELLPGVTREHQSIARGAPRCMYIVPNKPAANSEA
jgi:predicted ArsR family transcriptional regulator